MTCDDHQDLIQRVTRIEANTATIIESLSRLEDRIYTAHGAVEKTDGLIKSAAKIAGIAAALAAALAAAVAAVAAVVNIALG